MLYDPKHDLDQTSLDILAAAELLEKGWCQNTYQTTPSDDKEVISYCAVGALLRVIGLRDNRRMDDACARIAKYLPDYGRHKSYLTHRGLEKYNDTTGRTQTEIITLFKTAANAQPE